MRKREIPIQRAATHKTFGTNEEQQTTRTVQLSDNSGIPILMVRIPVNIDQLNSPQVPEEIPNSDGNSIQNPDQQVVVPENQMKIEQTNESSNVQKQATSIIDAAAAVVNASTPITNSGENSFESSRPNSPSVVLNNTLPMSLTRPGEFSLKSLTMYQKVYKPNYQHFRHHQRKKNSLQ